MTELAETYLGNLTENETLSERIEKARHSECFLEVDITEVDSRKGRIYARSNSGIDIGIVKSRDWLLREGDVLETAQGKLVLIHLRSQKVLVISFSEQASNFPIELIHLGHVLGNHHWPIIVQNNKIYVELITDAEVVESTIRGFHIPGLQVEYELRSPHEYLSFSHHSQHQHHS
ncbi:MULTISPECIES: urease accessory protein UreE [Aerosakkonema]|uniref:urease accessory protein UreE n=1 Tax=Aerosakkonema TaxID=1246629 RepID=UPI0035B82242